MSLHLTLILGLVLATLLCAVVTLLLYRRSPKTWYWLASATIGGFIAYLLYDGLLSFSGISQQLALIPSLVLAALLYALYPLLYHRIGIRTFTIQKPMSTKGWYAYIGTVVAILLFFGLLGFFGLRTETTVVAAAYGTNVGSLWVWWWRSRTR
jgi:hypothetical protein